MERIALRLVPLRGTSLTLRLSLRVTLSPAEWVRVNPRPEARIHGRD